MQLQRQQEYEIRESIGSNVEFLFINLLRQKLGAELRYPSEYHSQNHETLSSDSDELGKVRDELSDAYFRFPVNSYGLYPPQ